MLDIGGDSDKSESIDQLRDLWASVSSYPVYQSEEAMLHFLNTMCKILGAHSGTWLAMKKLKSNPRRVAADDYAVILEQLGGWAPVAAVYTSKSKNLNGVMNRWLMHARKEGVDPLSQTVLDNFGKSRVHISAELDPELNWADSWLPKKYFSYYGIGDRMMGLYYLTDDCESCLVFDRPADSEAFSAVEKNVLYLAMTGSTELHKRLLMEHGVIRATTPLSKRERETYRLLLTEMSESQIADKMKLSMHTVHDYARGLYKKFQVKGRVGLMALVLGH
ncbi:hypothetical protein NT6N_20410 [Oceaniferula spumae]|uniref:HTH luxR-type domain-containing protein n=1 Tax=Oceaniferula spumae TaxID=2979115 RepID=A0AAT9FLW2_9BACT